MTYLSLVVVTLSRRAKYTSIVSYPARKIGGGNFLINPRRKTLRFSGRESSLPQFLLTFHLAEFNAADLARNRLGQALHKLDLARVLIGCRHALDMLL